MNEVFSMWKHTRMVVLVALSAAIYASVLIPFKGFVLIPGITELRPAGALPVVLGLLFGPAGAWGAAIGNLIGDFFGSLGVGSVFGMIGNFYFAYVPYKLWNKLGMVKGDDPEPLLVKGGAKIVNYVVVSIMGSLACALIIAWGLDLLQLVPFAALATIISLNNTIPSIVIGLPLMMVLYPRIKKWDLLWTEIVDSQELEQNPRLGKLGGLIMIAGIIFGLAAGLALALGMNEQALFAAGFGKGQIGGLNVVAAAGIGVALCIIGGIMQK